MFMGAEGTLGVITGATLKLFPQAQSRETALVAFPSVEAALDVFVEEPLPPKSPLWHAPNCLISPHMSGDYIEFESAMADQFMVNWARYLAGEPLLNLVDKKLGFVPGSRT
jgi:phosphoglycerate dehydrogenase-like enzyme